MRKCNVLLALILSYYTLQAQEGYKITYRHCVQIDTSATLTDTIGIEAQLTGNMLVSNYTYGGKKRTSTTSAQTGSGNTAVWLGTPTDKYGNMAFYDKASDSVFVRDKVSSGYILIQEKRPLINWQITDEKKVINNYNCQKATAYFRGRNYTAWFAPDILLNEGPWKFKGLPGLILAIEDDKQQVKIYAEKIELLAKAKVAPFVTKGRLITPAAYITYRDEDYERTMQLYRKNGYHIPHTTTAPKRGYYGIEKSLD